MFKQIDGRIINLSYVIKVEYCGIDPKDEKEYCKIFMSGGNDMDIIVEGNIESIQDFLNK